jgi:hypothetical protein
VLLASFAVGAWISGCGESNEPGGASAAKPETSIAPQPDSGTVAGVAPPASDSGLPPPIDSAIPAPADLTPTDHQSVVPDVKPVFPPDTGPSTLTHITASIDGVPTAFASTVAYWDIGSKSLTVIGKTGTMWLKVLYQSKVPGSFTCGGYAYHSMQYTPGIKPAALYNAGGSFGGGNCSLTLKQFGAVGQIVTGTFKGTLALLLGGSGVPVTITNGSFLLQRGYDLGGPAPPP